MSPEADGYIVDDDPFERTPERILEVARAHTTRVAAEWGGATAQTVSKWRREVDGYYRGPGRPSRAELEAEPARADCPCPRCRELVSDAAKDYNHRQLAIARVVDNLAFRGGHSLLDSWRADAACLGADTDLFFPTAGDATATPKAVCADCPVAQRCLTFAMDQDITVGIWGGLSGRERQDLRKTWRRPPAAARAIDHGTDSGYRSGCRCTACTGGHRRYQMRYGGGPS